MSRALLADGRRRRLAVFAGAVVGVLVLAWLLLGSARAALGIAVMVGAALVIYRATRNDDAARWRRGAVGEQRTARMLRGLERRGFVVLHDRAIGATDVANIDHLVIGPPGVIVVDSKHWNRATTIKGRRGQIWVGRTPGAKVIAGTAVERRRVTQVLAAEFGTQIEVLAVLAVHGAKLPYWRAPQIEGMPLLRARAVSRWITKLPVRYDAATVAELANAAERRFPPYTAPEQRP